MLLLPECCSQGFAPSWLSVQMPHERGLCVCLVISHVQLFATPWTGACQAPLFMEFSRQEYWSGLPFSSSRGSSPPRNWSCLSCDSCIAGRFLTCWATGEALKRGLTMDTKLLTAPTPLHNHFVTHCPMISFVVPTSSTCSCIWFLTPTSM